jgi:hypothetical protein
MNFSWRSSSGNRPATVQRRALTEPLDMSAVSSLSVIVDGESAPVLERGFVPNPTQAARDYELMRQRMASFRPQVLVVIASDNLNHSFMHNMPASLIGKARRAEGPFPREVRTFGIAPYRTDINIAAAKGVGP